MTSFWLSFRLHDSDGWEDTYNERRAALYDEIETASGGGKNWWISTTSFIIFNSDETIDSMIFRVKRAIAEEVDLVVIGMNAFLGGWIIGNLEDADILRIVPGLIKV